MDVANAISNDFLKDWSYHEAVTYLNAYKLHPKNFFKIAQAVGTKTTKECIFFYFHVDKKYFASEPRGSRRRAQDQHDEDSDQASAGTSPNAVQRPASPVAACRLGDICRLGCVCQSLLGGTENYVDDDHCDHPECMFDQRCIKERPSRKRPNKSNLCERCHREIEEQQVTKRPRLIDSGTPNKVSAPRTRSGGAIEASSVKTGCSNGAKSTKEPASINNNRDTTPLGTNVGMQKRDGSVQPVGSAVSGNRRQAAAACVKPANPREPATLNKADVVHKIHFLKREVEPPPVLEAGREVTRKGLSESAKFFRHLSGVIQADQGGADSGNRQLMLSPSNPSGSGSPKDCNGNSNGVSGSPVGNRSPTSTFPNLGLDDCEDEKALPVGQFVFLHNNQRLTFPEISGTEYWIIKKYDPTKADKNPKASTSVPSAGGSKKRVFLPIADLVITFGRSVQRNTSIWRRVETEIPLKAIFTPSLKDFFFVGPYPSKT